MSAGGFAAVCLFCSQKCDDIKAGFLFNRYLFNVSDFNIKGNGDLYGYMYKNYCAKQI